MSSDRQSEGQLEKWLAEGNALPEPGTRFTGLGELDKALLLAALSSRSSRPILAVFAGRGEARNIVSNLGFWLGEQEAARKVHYFPAVDFDFYRGLLPNPEVLCERNATLFHAKEDPSGQIFVTNTHAFLQRVFPAREFERATLKLIPSQEIDRDFLVHQLIQAGYQRQPACFDPGVFSVRGGVVDIFCPLYGQPLRLEFFGDQIEDIRFFDPQSQRSLEPLPSVSIIPVGQSLIPRGEDYDEAAEKVKSRLDHLGIPKARREEVLEKIQEGMLSTELSFLFPLLSRGSVPLLDYFPSDVCLVWDGRKVVKETAEETELPRLRKSLELYEKQPLPIASFDELFLTEAEFRKELERSDAFSFESFSQGPGSGKSGDGPELRLGTEPVQLASSRDLAGKAGNAHSLDAFSTRFKTWMDQGYRVQIVCHTRTHAEKTQRLLEPYGLSSFLHPENQGGFPAILKTDFTRLNLWQGAITESRIYPLLHLVMLSEEEIFGQKKRATRAPARSAKWTGGDASRILSSFRDLKVGDYVVHRDHGIGRYLGLKSMDFLGVANDYVLLEYRDGDKLYIPVYRLNVLQKYVGGEGAGPQLDKLGADRWSKAKGKAQRAIAELAGEFLKIHAKRKLVPAYPFKEPSADYRQFEMEFPFDETPDQMKAIEEVMADLSLPHPMDRLICGDVGYGKTEVAMRGAYRAVLDNKQVAVLVPTTVLAFQHYENFKRRFRNTGARVEMVSRLRGTAETKKVLAEVKAGKVDILIGTHRLLSSDIGFRDLGLVVVDEEHRFGVVHKERLKRICESVHVLSMTATPIPRTLNMAMTGIKDISVITTPPPDRLSVRTFICRSEPEVIAEAITNELAREGQVFFVHNRIGTLGKVADELKRLLPKVSVEMVHGQMDGETLEEKMLSFYTGQAQILLTTAIIESGLDIPRANTIIIDQANHFGLAQLYQLRGRVGRSEKRAYCYLLVPSETSMTDEAKERLQVIQRYTDLGSGFHIASHDLELRGAGDLLGKDQSGHLAAIGVDLYFELLEETMRELRGEEKRVEIEPEISMKISASFPNDYLPDITERIQIYRRLSGVETEEGISEIESEIRDRFGAPPEEVINLLGLMRIKLLLKRLHVVRMSCGPKRTSLQFAPTTPVDPQRLVRLVTKEDPDDRYSLTPDQKLVFNVEDTDWKSQLKEIERLSQRLGIDF